MMHLLLSISLHLLQLVLCCSTNSGRLSVLFLHGYCEGEGYSTKDLGLEVAARLAAVDVGACSESPVELTPIAAPADPSGNSDLDVLLEAFQPSLFNSSLQHIAVIYPGCSSVLKVVADVLSSSVYQIPLLTFSFPCLPYDMKNDYHIHMTPNEAHLPPAIVATIKLFGWQRVAILTENKPVFTELGDLLMIDLESEGIDIHHQLTLDPAQQLPDIHTLVSEDVKIFILSMNPSLARAVLCKALNTLKYPGYVWITHGWYMDGWWEEGVGNGDKRTHHTCTEEELAVYLENSIAVSHYPLVLDEDEREEEVGSGDQPLCLKSAAELSTEFHRHTTISSVSSTPHMEPSRIRAPDYATLVYDAVWTGAIAYFTGPLSSSGRYQNTIDAINFYGTSGPVSFFNGSRGGVNLTLIQYRMLNGQLQKVPVAALIPTVTVQGNHWYNVSYFEGEDPEIVWPDGTPLDGTPIEVEHYPFLAVMAIIYTYCVLGVLFALACFMFNLVFRKKKLIRLTSPNLNNIIVLGAIICYLSALTFFYPEGASRTGIAWGCNLRAWTTALGFSVCYGTLNVKMWRVYAICRKPKPTMSKTPIKDYHLMLLVLVFVMVDTLLLIVVMSLGNSQFTVITIPNKTEPYWISILFGYKAIIQAIGIFLAFKIRNIKIRGLNDSKEVSIMLYVTSVIMLAIIVVTFVYGDYIDVDGFVYGFGLSTAVTFVLFLTFVPKMVSLYQDPEGKHIFHGPAISESTPAQTYTSDPSEVTFLHKRIKDLEKQVELARSNENLSNSMPRSMLHPLRSTCLTTSNDYDSGADSCPTQ